MTQNAQQAAAPTTPAAADPKKLNTPDVYLRVIRDGASTLVHVKTSERWRALCRSRKYREQRLPIAADRFLVIHTPQDWAHRDDDVIGGAVFGVAVIENGSTRQLREGEEVSLPMTRPMPRKDIEPHVTEVRDMVVGAVDQYMRALELSVVVTAKIAAIEVA